MKHLISVFLGMLVVMNNGYCADPVVSNVRSSQRAGTKLVDITYDVTDADSSSLIISVTVSTNSGVTYDLPANHFSGSGYGANVTPGTNKTIVWDAGADYDGRYSTTMRLKITADDGSNPVIPPDPATVATSPSNGVATLLHDATAFLYTGANPIQSGVTAGTISTTQVAILRGRVLDQAGNVLSGVVVSVNSRPEFGWTVSRTNGGYDMAVNGGGTLNLNYRKTGYLALQRTLNVPWQDYVNVDDVRLLTADANVTVLLMPGTNMQVARGGVVSDERGTRQATLLVPSNVIASVITYQGTTQQVNSLTTRFTEYTVGPNGPEAMPGELPPTVAYTYAMNLGADEAQAKVAGKDVLFNASVYYYLDNFLGFSPGTPAPHGYYDNDAGAWVPTPDGWVLQLMGTNAAGLARICLSTNSIEADAATLVSFGFTDEERRMLAQVYPLVTNSLWRIPITHFSCGDVNWPATPPPSVREGATSPKLNLSGSKDNREDKPATRPKMGTIEVENRVFREAMPVVGTPFTLNYASNRGTGYVSRLTIPLSESTLPNGLISISLDISVAGRRYTNTFAAQNNLQYEFSWDGKDIYGRTLAGEQPVSITVGYIYETFYGIWRIAPNVTSFGRRGFEIVPGNVPGPPVTYYQRQQVTIGSPPSPKDLGVGGWTFNVQHSYDPVSKTIFMGDGRTRQAENFKNFRVITTVAGNGTNGWHIPEDIGLMATGVAVRATGLAYGRDSTLYLSENVISWVRQVRPDGRIYLFAGNVSPQIGFSGDGGPATNADLNMPQGLCMGPDGSVYIADRDNHRIRRVDTNGIITTVAGNGTAAWSGDGGPATNASLSSPMGVAAAEDGTLYIADRDNYRVRVVMPDQTIYTLAGTGADATSGDGGVSTNAAIGKPYGVACDLHGNVYIASWSQSRVRKVDVHGIISTVAGGGVSWSEGMAATNANLGSLDSVAISPDGVLYIGDGGWSTVRQVSPLGFIATLAGDGTYDTNRVAVGDNGPAPNGKIFDPSALALSPNGDVYISDWWHNRIRRVLPSLPSLSYSDLFIPSENGQLVYNFTPDGRHLRTLHALTGETLLTFGYTAGRLTSITDGDGNITTIARDASGNPTAIVSPYDQHTTVTLTSDGYLATLVNPASETTSFTYSNSLLASVTGARGPSYTYTVTYDAGGRVVRGADPAGGYTAISKSSWSNDYLACSTTAMGRTSSILMETLTSDARRRTETLPDGTVSRSDEYLNGVSSNWLPSGIIYSKSTGPDPRFGMQAPVFSCTLIRTPAGLLTSNTVERAITLTNSLLGVGSYTVTDVQNGRARTTTFTGSNRQVNVVSPAGRQYQTWLDGQGRMIRRQISGFSGVTNVYDSHGRLSSTRVGDRITTYAYYNSDGYLQTKTDALGRTNTFVYDAAGRVTTATLPGSRVVNYGYDAHGNMTSITPPDRSAHSFAYNLVDLPSEYTPPVVDGVTNTTYYTYNADRQRTSIRKPGGLTISNAYNAAGQLSTVTIPNTTYTYYWQTNGLLGGITAASGVGITNEYDGSLVTATRWSGSVTGRVSRTYDNDFRAASLSVNGANTIVYKYDADSLMTNAGLCTFSRDAANGLLTGCTLSNVAETLSYNGFGEITNLTVSCNGTNLFVVNYMFDRLGRITNLAETIQSTNRSFGYTYDSAGRLAQVVTNVAGTNLYYYDGNGNRTNWQVAGIVSVASNDAQDHLRSSASSLQTNVYTYNAAGDLTNKTVNSSNTMYQYDALGNLLSVILPAGITNEYLVDGKSRRVGRKINGVLTNGFLYANQLNPVAALDGNLNVVSVFVYGSRTNVPDYMIRGGMVYRIISDHLGSPRLVVQAETGGVVQRMDYDEFGRVVLDTNPGFQPFGFAGGLYDADLGLVRFGARDYDAETGRWTARDPILFSGGADNLYAYVENDPVNGRDILGMGPGRSAVGMSTWGGTGSDFAMSTWGGSGSDFAMSTWGGSGSDFAMSTWGGSGSDFAMSTWGGSGSDFAMGTWGGSGSDIAMTTMGGSGSDVVMEIWGGFATNTAMTIIGGMNAVGSELVAMNIGNGGFIYNVNSFVDDAEWRLVNPMLTAADGVIAGGNKAM